MTKQEAELVLEATNDARRLNIKVVSDYLYTDNGGDSVSINGFSPKEMSSLLLRVVNTIRDAIINDDWRFLPNKLFDSSESLHSVLKKIISSVNAGNPFEQWASYLSLLVQYARQNGLWGHMANINDEELSTLKSEMRKLNRELQEKLEEVSSLNETTVTRRNDVEIIHGQYEHEKHRLARVQMEADNIIKDLRAIGLDTANINGKATSFLEQMTSNIEATQRVLEQERDKFGEMSSVVNDLKQDFDTAVIHLQDVDRSFTKTLEEAKEKEVLIFSRKEEIDKLLRFAADGTLGGVFNLRQAKMNTQVWVWVALSAISVLGAAYWAFHVFELYGTVTATGTNWLVYLSNIVRTAPGFILVFFCLAQYTKERNIQEEYAFKAAVSMTITAYSEMFGDGAAAERVKMLISTVQGVYTPPVLGKPFKPFSFRTKDLSELSKNLLELSKNVQEMASDALKAKKASDSVEDKDKK